MTQRSPVPRGVRIRRTLGIVLLAGLWLAGVAICGRKLMSYETTAGEGATAPREWPARLPFARSTDRYTLVMLAHPRCPCTQSTLDELAELVSQSRGRLGAVVVFVLPVGVDSAWTHTRLRAQAASIPGVLTYTDKDSRVAGVFHSHTSGQVLLYDPAGRLAFSGGLTGARGHAGKNLGYDAALAQVTHGAGPATAPVYGCPLANPHAAARNCAR